VIEIMKQGDIVTIYEDPFTRKKPEGKAKLLVLIEAARRPRDFQRWSVKFLSDGFVAERFIQKDKIICPECNEEIDSLRNIQTGTMEYRLKLDVQGDIQYETCEFELDAGVNVNEYWCPECEAVLFTDESKAIDFLKGD
jgi:uncharacterized protein with PIN domain